MIDAHIHLEMYAEEDQEKILQLLNANRVQSLISVSMHLDSSKRTLDLARKNPGVVHPCFGFHPEQPILEEHEIIELFDWITAHKDVMVAIGEVGLPYYTKMAFKAKGLPFDLGAYIRLLDRFVALAKQLDKPIVLHTVYEDAKLACDVLEKHGHTKAHFHWFKGPEETIKRMIANGYYISITPDVIYESEIQQLVERYPLERMMVETDGPWPFEGPFAGQTTSPSMMAYSIEKIAEIKKRPPQEVHALLLENTKNFYQI
jgi:TatD DNase family protein